MALRRSSDPKPEDVLSRRERLSFWFATNRRWLGSVVGLIAIFFRVSLHFEGHSEVADNLKALADFLMLVGVGTASAGTFKPDEQHLERKEALIRSRSGQFPAFTDIHAPRP